MFLIKLSVGVDTGYVGGGVPLQCKFLTCFLLLLFQGGMRLSGSASLTAETRLISMWPCRTISSGFSNCTVDSSRLDSFKLHGNSYYYLVATVNYTTL